MQLEDFDYHLPAQLIAQQPAARREAARLLQLTSSGLHHGQFTDLPALLRAGDLLVVNNTRVIKARLFARKDSGGEAELLVERLLDDHHALCQVRVSKPLRAGRTLALRDAAVTLTCAGREGQFYRLRFSEPVLQVLEQAGHMPLPPYIQRPDTNSDRQRYQTVFSRVPGAVAAPTAGLHFSEPVLQQIRSVGVEIAEVTLHVGAGTFQPVRGDVQNHVMHQEWYELPAAAAAAVRAARQRGGRVVAVGTTVVRTLESAAIPGLGSGEPLQPHRGLTGLFIKPGFRFRVVDALVTNFHLPRSTLLMLVAAFAGHRPVMEAYRQAVAQQYRFFSYGDAMYLERPLHTEPAAGSVDV